MAEPTVQKPSSAARRVATARARGSPARKVILKGRIVRRTGRQRALALISTIASVLYWGFSWAVSIGLHALVMLLFLLWIVSRSKPDEPISIGFGSSDRGVTVDLQGPEDDEQVVEAPEETPMEDEPVTEPVIQGEAQERNTPDVETPVEDRPNEGDRSELVQSEAPTMDTDDLYRMIVPQAMGPSGASGAPAALTQEMGRMAQQDATAAIRSVRQRELGSLARGDPHQILVTHGEHDHIERVLSRLGIRYVSVRIGDLPTLDLSSTRAILVNCANELEPSRWRNDGDPSEHIERLERRMAELLRQFAGTSDPTLRSQIQQQVMQLQRQAEWVRTRAALADRLREFVAQGGYLFTTDWAVSIVERSFPGTLQAGSQIRSEFRVVIEAEPGAGEHPLLALTGLDSASRQVTRGWQLAWEVASGSYRVVTTGRSVERLVRSREGSVGLIVATFRWSGTGHEPGGRVMHLQSHFEAQKSATGDFVMQSLLLNFIFEAFGSSNR